MERIYKAREYWEAMQQAIRIAKSAKCNEAHDDYMGQAHYWEKRCAQEDIEAYTKWAEAEGWTPLEPYDLRIQSVGDKRP